MPELDHSNHTGIGFTRVGDELRASVTGTQSFTSAGSSSGGVWTRVLAPADDGKLLYHYGGDTPTLSVPLLPVGFRVTLVGVWAAGASLTITVTGVYDEVHGPVSLLMGSDGAPVSVSLVVSPYAGGSGAALQIIGSGADAPPNAQTGTSYTLTMFDANRVVTRSNSSANTTTVPTNASVPFPVGTVIPVVRLGSGVSSVAAATGVTINGNGSTPSFPIPDQYQNAVLLKIGTNTWVLSGAV